MKRLLVSLALAISLPGLGLHAASDAPPEAKKLLQEGLFEEEANRDFEKAAAAYAGVVAQYDADRSLAATAIFRLAEVRARQGQKEVATRLYNRLLAEFPNSEALVKLSRDRLAALGAPAAKTAPSAGGGEDEITNEEAQELVRVRDLVKNSPDLINGPLVQAAQAGWFRVCTFLLDNGADLNASPSDAFPLTAAAENGRKSVVELLIQRGAKVNAFSVNGKSALHEACAAGRLAVVSLLLDKGADINLAARPEKDPEHILPTPLRAAIHSGNSELVSLLLERGADMENCYALFQAVGEGNIEVASLLISRGAKIEATPTKQLSPLLTACVNGNLEMAKLLLDKGANANVASPDDAAALRGGGITPLHVATQTAPALMPLLVAHGANINVANKSGETPLHSACKLFKSVEQIERIIELGADPTLKDHDGKTAIDDIDPFDGWLALARKHLFPVFARERTVHVYYWKDREDLDIHGKEHVPWASETSDFEFDAPPTLFEILSATQNENSRWDRAFDCAVSIYRSSEASPAELRTIEIPSIVAGNDAGAELPKIQYGDVLVLRRGAEITLDTLRRWYAQQYTKEELNITLKIGERTQKIALKGLAMSKLERSQQLHGPQRVGNDPGLHFAWSPVDGELPHWTLSELVAAAVELEPDAQLDAITLVRAVRGDASQYKIDLRLGHGDEAEYFPDDSGFSKVKQLRARLADGDTIVIPIPSVPGSKSLAARRKAIFRAAPGRLFGDLVFQQSEGDPAGRTLAEVVSRAYHSEMVVPNPDFAHIVIHRLKEDSNEEDSVLVDLAAIIRSRDWSESILDDARAADVALQWGDVVEIPQFADVANYKWTGLSDTTKMFLIKALQRNVTFKVDKSNPKDFQMGPAFLDFQSGGWRWPGRDTTTAMEALSTFDAMTVIKANPGLDKSFRKLILVREGLPKREFTRQEFEAANPWILHGDTIEIVTP